MATPVTKDTLKAGERLEVNQALVSKCGRFKLVLQPHGNVILYKMIPTLHPLWSTPTAKHGIGHRYFFYMQGNGNIVLYKDQVHPKHAIWHSKTNGKSGANSRLVVQGDGNLVGVSDYSL